MGKAGRCAFSDVVARIVVSPIETLWVKVNVPEGCTPDTEGFNAECCGLEKQTNWVS